MCKKNGKAHKTNKSIIIVIIIINNKGNNLTIQFDIKLRISIMEKTCIT